MITKFLRHWQLPQVVTVCEEQLHGGEGEVLAGGDAEVPQLLQLVGLQHPRHVRVCEGTVLAGLQGAEVEGGGEQQLGGDVVGEV